MSCLLSQVFFWYKGAIAYIEGASHGHLWDSRASCTNSLSAMTLFVATLILNLSKILILSILTKERTRPTYQSMCVYTVQV